MHAERKITVCSHKHSFTPYPSLSPYSWMDRITDRETNTLAAHGLEGLFFKLYFYVSFLGVTYLPYQLCHCVFFLVAAGNSFGLHRSVFWLWRETVLGVSLIYHTSCAVVSVFGCGRK